MRNALRDAACAYVIEKQWHLFPVYPMMKQPHGTLVPQGHKEASAYAPDILYWWGREPAANIGLACRKSGLVVIDVDPRNGGEDSFWELCRQLGEPVAPRAETATSGSHYFFEHPGEEFEFHKEIAPGVDIKDNGYVLLAPSARFMGEYAWDTEGDPKPLPDAWLGRMLRTARKAPREPLQRSDEPLLNIPAAEYIEVLTGREPEGGWFRCPFHKEGNERTPSLKTQGAMWSCFGCEPIMGKEVMGGNIVDFAGVLWGYAMPVRGIDLAEVMNRLHTYFEPC